MTLVDFYGLLIYIVPKDNRLGLYFPFFTILFRVYLILSLIYVNPVSRSPAVCVKMISLHSFYFPCKKSLYVDPNFRVGRPLIQT